MKNSVVIVVDLGFGDSGKGTMVDYLTHINEATTVVRFNGGAQAAHNVVLADGTHHTFSQLGSGTFNGACTYLSGYVLVDPVTLVTEADALKVSCGGGVLKDVSIDVNCPVVTPYNKLLNRLTELSLGNTKHGSCGMGIGDVMSDIHAKWPTMRASTVMGPMTEIRRKLSVIKDQKLFFMDKLAARASVNNKTETTRIMDLAESSAVFHNFMQAIELIRESVEFVEANYLEEVLKTGNTVFEGAQGVLLDEKYGFHPHTTWSNCTFGNAIKLLNAAGYTGHIERVGVIRAYMTRHGAGPFVTEDFGMKMPEPHNKDGIWQNSVRFGWQDMVMLRYALNAVQGVDHLAITCMDHVDALESIKVCNSYTDGMHDLPLSRNNTVEQQQGLTWLLKQKRPIYDTVTPDDYIDYIETAVSVPVRYISTGPTREEKEIISNVTTSITDPV